MHKVFMNSCSFFPLKECCSEQNCFNEIKGNSVNKICLLFLSVFGLSSVMHYEIWRGEVYEGLKRQKIKLLGNSCANYPPKHILVYIRPSEIVRLLWRDHFLIFLFCFVRDIGNKCLSGNIRRSARSQWLNSYKEEIMMKIKVN